jgi:hypothetical protein
MLRAVSSILVVCAALSAVTVIITVSVTVFITVTLTIFITVIVDIGSALFDVSLVIVSHFYAFSAVTSASASSAAAAALAALAAVRFLGDRLVGDSVESKRRAK